MAQNRKYPGSSLGGWLLSLTLMGMPASAQTAPPGQPPGGQNTAWVTTPEDPPAEQVFRNIQALKGMPKSQLAPIMEMISASLGMRCNQCHVPEAFDKDDKRGKQTARRMIQMVLDLNKNSFNGRPSVSCNSCHRGQQRPDAVPAFTQVVSQTAPAGSQTEGPGARTAGPAFEQIAEKYIQAVGGGAAFDKLKSRIMKGTTTSFSGESTTTEITQAAPNKIAITDSRPNGPLTKGFNGTSGWIQYPSRSEEVTGDDLAQLRRSAEFARPLKLKEEYLNPRGFGKAKVGEREAYQVMAQADGQRVRLFFDVENGLLLRRMVMSNTVLGSFPQQTDYEDYREVDGVKLPFVVKQFSLDANAISTTTFSEIKHNIPIDDKKFDPPRCRSKELQRPAVSLPA